MARKTKATLENDILNLKRDINILTRQKKENENPSQFMWCIQKRITVKIGITKMKLT